MPISAVFPIVYIFINIYHFSSLLKFTFNFGFGGGFNSTCLIYSFVIPSNSAISPINYSFSRNFREGIFFQRELKPLPFFLVCTLLLSWLSRSILAIYYVDMITSRGLFKDWRSLNCWCFSVRGSSS